MRPQYLGGFSLLMQVRALIAAHTSTGGGDGDGGGGDGGGDDGGGGGNCGGGGVGGGSDSISGQRVHAACG